MKNKTLMPGPALGASVLLVLAMLFCGCLSGVAQRPDVEPRPPSDPEEAERLVQLGSRGFRVHDPSTILQSGDEYWIFHTGRGVSSARSTNLIHWQRGPRIFTNAPAWVADVVPENRRMHYWAPDAIRVGNRYLVYYSVSSFGKNTSAIALTTNPTLDPDDPAYKWTDQGVVIQSNPTVDYNAIDPAMFQDEDGSLWMSFGSFWGGIKMIELDPASGKRIAPDSPVYGLAHSDSIEAPFIYRHGDHYYLFVNWGFCCRGEKSTYEIRVGRSAKVTGPYLDMEGRDLLLSGGTLFLGKDGAMIGPGHAGILREGEQYQFGYHFYDGTRRGASTYAIRPLRWEEDGWPTIRVAGP